MGELAPATADLVQRVKAFATTEPIHALDEHKAKVSGADFTTYRMVELALLCIDSVTVAMDFQSGAREDAVLEVLARHAAAQAPDRDPAEHRRVASWVLEKLLNTKSPDGFRHEYGTWGPEGYTSAVFTFKLVVEVFGADGETYLRATDEAVNVLVGALDVDVAAAQQAADLRLDHLIQRGRLSEAQAVAREARYRTIQYGERLRRDLEATRRDIRTVDWAETMPRLLSDALAHVAARISAENQILAFIVDVHDSAETAERKARAAEVISLVRDCLRRHQQLHLALMSAREQFRREQDRQEFSRVPRSVSFDVNGQLLQPALRATVGELDGPAERFLTSVVGVRAPRVLRLADFFDMLLTPVTPRDLLGAELEEPDIDESELPARFSDATYAHLKELLALDPEAPRRLSGLLAEARERQARDPEVRELDLLVTIRVLALAAQEIGSARRHGDDFVMVALDDGTILDDPVFSGADLLVGRAAIQDEERDQRADLMLTGTENLS